jgi:exopolysaccharide production protein ExoZ
MFFYEKPVSTFSRHALNAAMDMRPANTSQIVQGPILPVQMLRAVAALMVVVHHAQHEAGSIAAAAGRVFVRVDGLPWMAGVDIFFVISGFIMVHASGRLYGRAGGAATFLKRRLWRIVPLYWLVTTLFLGVVLLKADVLNSAPRGFGEIAASYLFWPVARADGNIQPVFSLGWTLNYEMLFYVIFAAALLLRRGRTATVACVALGLGGLVLGARWLPMPLSWWGQPIVLEFAAGMAIGLVHAAHVRLGPGPRLALALAGLALLASVAATLLAPLPALALSGLAATLLVAAAALGPAQAVPASLPARLLARLGDASYALYLTHPFVLRAGRELSVRLGLSSPPLFIALMLVATCLAALLIHRWFERPLARAVRQG